MRATHFAWALVVLAVTSAVAAANDEQIAAQIVQQLEQLRAIAQLKDFNIGVQVDKGTVTMMGQVADAQQALLALDVARRTPDVKLVVNDLYVNASANLPSPGPSSTVTAPVSVGGAAGTSADGHATGWPNQASPAISESTGDSAPDVSFASGSTTSARLATPVTYAAPDLGPVAGPGVTPTTAERRAMPVSRFRSQRHQPPVAFARSRSIPAARQASHDEIVGQTVPYNSDVVTGSYLGSGAGPMPLPAQEVAFAGTASYDNPQMPAYAWPSYAAYPNYGALTYPHQYSAAAWPYIGPFYPYPQVPLGWRKVMLEWDDGWWFLDFKAK